MTDEDYEELQALRVYHARQLKLESQRKVTLEEDIDAPIRQCIMAFALLGCDPQWSCCGFDFEGQPIHKWHRYGEVYFALHDCPATREIVAGFMALGNHGVWEATTGIDGIPKIEMRAILVQPEQWRDKECPHYHEPAAYNIAILEDYLLSRHNDMAEEAVLRDTNTAYQKMFSTWQYPAKPDWVIHKSDLEL